MSRPEYDALVDAVARKMAEILTDNGLPVSSPDEGDLDDVERERWNVTLEILLARVKTETGPDCELDAAIAWRMA